MEHQTYKPRLAACYGVVPELQYPSATPDGSTCYFSSCAVKKRPMTLAPSPRNTPSISLSLSCSLFSSLPIPLYPLTSWSFVHTRDKALSAENIVHFCLNTRALFSITVSCFTFDLCRMQSGGERVCLPTGLLVLSIRDLPIK